MADRSQIALGPRARYTDVMRNLAHALAEYDAARPALEVARAQLESDLRTALASADVDVQFVSSRVKSAESLRKKIARPDKTYASIWDVTDLVGVRIATYFEDSIVDVARLIEQRYRVDFAHSTDKLRSVDHGRFGYRSLHYVCAHPDVHPAFRFEIQVRTALQHAWAEIEHDLGYKAKESVPESIRRRFARVAGLLEIADQEFVSIRADLAAYREQAHAQLADSAQALPLDVVTLVALLESDAIRALDGAVAEALALPLVDDAFFPEYLTRMLALASLTTTRAVHDAVKRHGPRVQAAITPYFGVAAKLWQLEPASLPAVARGYSLLFLAHLVILDGDDLALGKVARLASMYRALDYPDDEREALKVASELVAALAQPPRTN